MMKAIARLVLGTILILTVSAMLASCGAFDWGGGIKTKWRGEWYLLAPGGLIAPSQAQAGVPVEIGFWYWGGGVSHALRKAEPIFDERKLELTINLWFQDFDLIGGSMPMSVYPIEGNVLAKFPKSGMWTIRSKDVSTEIAVRGKWIGNLQVSDVEDFTLPADMVDVSKARLRVTLKHPTGEWFYSTADTLQENDAKTITVTVYECKAESALPDTAWDEVVEIPIFLPTEGEWRLNIGERCLAIRFVRHVNVYPEYVIPGEPPEPWEEGLYDGIPQCPEEVGFPEQVHAQSPTDCVIVFQPKNEHARTQGMDFKVDPEGLRVEGKLWVNTIYEYGDEPVPMPEEHAVTVVFPVAGEWTIRFEGEEGVEPFTTTVNVLPAEGA